MTVESENGRLTEFENSLVSAWRGMGDILLEEVKGVADVPSPTFHERERAQHVARRMRAGGLDPKIDEVGNVVARVKGESPGPLLVVTAHMDTVFSREEHRPPEQRENALLGPGVRDNSSAVAELILLAHWSAKSPPKQGDILFAGTVQEEGLGNLGGVRALLGSLPKPPGAVLVIDGNLGWIVHMGVGCVRWKLEIEAEGGHSWLNAGKPSAVHGLVRAMAAITALPRPSDPVVTLNVGMVSGGISVNAIATSAQALIDLRSTDESALRSFAGQIRETIGEELLASACRWSLSDVGRRPGGMIPPDHPLVGLASDVLRDLGLEARLTSASTEANIPLSWNIPAISIGSAVGQRMHTLEERLDIETLVPGLCQVGLVMHRLTANWQILKGDSV